ncbi:GGDEF domain-containing protein [Halodesulfovibrio marinisediminis]|uniref:diguanylate cyclase n=1 Tax=Halodesulfovibrio marinisediminis DSM 17456 TaxID=1121457 RepID=A0A1N6HZT9_9BACT|nr:GGDEF domain-containing protein [Halodesulfovibrio marinisediminis]SIO25296.1 diguanylate cyclase (GGDEF) domain-containing protein [Halodesulfovibrio marinisediminis DSM 17456]
MPLSDKTIRFTCNNDGEIKAIISDGVNFFNAESGLPAIESIMPSSSISRYEAFIEEVKSAGVSFCESLPLITPNKTYIFSLFGALKDDSIFVVALVSKEFFLFEVYQDLMKVINEQDSMLRQAQKRASMKKALIEMEKEDLLNEYMEVNSELAKMQRELLKQHAELNDTFHLVEKLSQTDVLTGVANRRHILEKLTEEIERSNSYDLPLSILSLDIDHFKKINDRYGHSAGDQALITFSQTCQSQLRDSDLFGRMGGEEFIAILPHTYSKDALVTAKRICGKIKSTSTFYENKQISFTVSVGVACYKVNEDLEAFLNRADQALYRAKNEGRNRVVTF